MDEAVDEATRADNLYVRKFVKYIQGGAQVLLAPLIAAVLSAWLAANRAWKQNNSQSDEWMHSSSGRLVGRVLSDCLHCCLAGWLVGCQGHVMKWLVHDLDRVGILRSHCMPPPPQLTVLHAP